MSDNQAKYDQPSAADLHVACSVKGLSISIFSRLVTLSPSSMNKTRRLPLPWRQATGIWNIVPKIPRTERIFCRRASIILSGIVISAGYFTIARADNVQPCVNAPPAKTLDFALMEQEETNQRAVLLKDLMKSFDGWRTIPSDVKIVAGPTTIHVLYPTDIRPLPAARSEASGGYRAESTLKADCMVVDPQGGLWAVIHYSDAGKGYIDSKDTDKTTMPVK